MGNSVKKKVKEQIESIKRARALRKIIDRKIKNDRKSVKGVIGKIRYTRHRANDYDEIYRQFGRKIYVITVPDRIRHQSLNNAMKEKRYMDVLDIHGEKTFNKKIQKIIGEDIKYESSNIFQRIRGWTRHILPRKIKADITETILPVTAVLLLAPAALIADGYHERSVREHKEHKVEIEEYLDDVKAYGEQIKQYNLTPLQTMMKVTDDMWSRIEGYGEPEIDLIEYAGLDVSKDLGVGVCRNMADDCARRLNAVDERFNARTLPVYVEDGEYEPADIDRRIVENEDEEVGYDSTTNDGNEEENKDEIENENSESLAIKRAINNFLDSSFKKQVANHAIVLVDVPGESDTLVLDPTNAAVGIYCNGEIKLFNSEGKAHPVEMKTTLYGSFVFGIGKALIEQPKSYISSIGIYTDKKMEELNERYGLLSQNDALDYVRSIGKEELQYTESLKVDGSYQATITIKEDEPYEVYTLKDNLDEDIEK